jgi:hypothetical protein
MMGQHDELIVRLRHSSASEHEMALAIAAADAIEQLKARLAEAQKDAHHYKVCYEASTRAFDNLTDRAEAAERSRDEIVGGVNGFLSSVFHDLNAHLVDMKPNYDDSIVGFNDAWKIVSNKCAALRSLIEAVETKSPAQP